MIKTSYKVLPQKTIYGVTIELLDLEVVSKVLMLNFTGYNLNDAIKNANKKLNQFGYYVE